MEGKTTKAKELQSNRVFGMRAESGRWIFVVVGLIIQLCLGAIYSWSIFVMPLRNNYGYSATDTLLPYMIFLAVFAIVMPFSGRLIQRYGPKIVCLIGGALTGISWILAGFFAKSLPLLVVTYGVIGGVGVGLAYGAPISTSTNWFPDKKGLAVGLTVAGFGLSPLIIVNIGTKLINSPLGVTGAFQCLGIAFGVISMLLALLLKFPKKDWKPQGWIKAKASTVTESLDASQMIKTKSFWGLWSCFTIGSLAGLMAIGIAKPVGSEIIALRAETATLLTSIFAIFNGGGRPLFGWLTDMITPRYTAAITFILIAIGSVGMLFAGMGTFILYIVCFIFFYLALGGWLAIAPSATVTYFGPENNASNYGIVFTAYGLGAILGNLISGMSRDIFGSYINAFFSTLILALIGIGLAVTLLRPVKGKR